MESEQDDGVFVEDEVEGEAETKELQFFGVFAQRDRRLIDDPQATMAEISRVLTQQ